MTSLENLACQQSWKSIPSTGGFLKGMPPNFYYGDPSFPVARAGPCYNGADHDPTDSFQGPSFEGPHPPTLGPQSAGNSFEALPNEDSSSHRGDYYEWASFNVSDPPSRTFSRGDSATHLEIDCILRDSGCDAQDSPTECTAADSRFCGGALEEELRAAVARALSICAFERSETDNLLESCPGLRSAPLIAPPHCLTRPPALPEPEDPPLLGSDNSVAHIHLPPSFLSPSHSKELM